MEYRLWGGRFKDEFQANESVFREINYSINIDKRLYKHDILGSIAYASALNKALIINDDELSLITDGLNKILTEWTENKFEINSSDEDIHTAVERRLAELIGKEVAGKLHTGRSRNDQVTTDTKFWLIQENYVLIKLISQIIQAIISKSKEHIKVIMPGYTHLQRAQPIRLSHWLLSHAWFLRSDGQRLMDILNRAKSESPLGSGALAGNPFAIDRIALANSLGFKSITLNSMYGVSDRDFVVEFIFWASLTPTHLSKFAEDLILYSTTEFGFINCDERLTSGSSLMPHKRNPDGLELVRAKSATISAQCYKMLTLLKGIPSTYNKDLQEDKLALFTTFDEIKLALKVILLAVEGLEVNSEKCASSLSVDMLTTDLAYYLVKKGVPFREAHHLVGQLVCLSEAKSIDICNLSLEDLKSVSNKFERDTVEIWDFNRSVEQYQAEGGTCEENIYKQINSLEIYINNWSQN